MHLRISIRCLLFTFVLLLLCCWAAGQFSPYHIDDDGGFDIMLDPSDLDFDALEEAESDTDFDSDALFSVSGFKKPPPKKPKKLTIGVGVPVPVPIYTPIAQPVPVKKPYPIPYKAPYQVPIKNAVPQPVPVPQYQIIPQRIVKPVKTQPIIRTSLVPVQETSYRTTKLQPYADVPVGGGKAGMNGLGGGGGGGGFGGLNGGGMGGLNGLGGMGRGMALGGNGGPGGGYY